MRARKDNCKRQGNAIEYWLFDTTQYSYRHKRYVRIKGEMMYTFTHTKQIIGISPRSCPLQRRQRSVNPTKTSQRLTMNSTMSCHRGTTVPWCATPQYSRKMRFTCKWYRGSALCVKRFSPGKAQSIYISSPHRHAHDTKHHDSHPK